MNSISRRILCVESNVDISLMLDHLLGRAGYEVVITGTIGAALYQASKGGFDLFILNLRYSDGNGICLCEKLRQRDNKTPILFFASIGNNCEKELAIKAGAQVFLQQPGNLNNLLDTVKMLIGEQNSLPINSRSASS